MEIRIYQTGTGAVIEYPEGMSEKEALERAYAYLKQNSKVGAVTFLLSAYVV